MRIIDRSGLDALIRGLRADGREVVGPRLCDGAIVYDALGSVDDLPAGWTDEQAAGRYRVSRRDDEALFGYVVGPHSWKRFLYPPAERLWRAKRSGRSFDVEATEAPAPRYAFIGARGCELAAMAVQARVFDGCDPAYAQRLANLFVVAVNCGEPGGTCFCVSMGTGPRATTGYDLALTELRPGECLVEIGTDRGAKALAGVPSRPASEAEVREARRVSERAAARMGRTLDVAGLPERLKAVSEHPRWAQVAERCLTCANCTMACPTCFCSTVEDVTDLTGDHAERWRKWDSCFTMDFSYLHGGSVRASASSRYRQWLTHKLGTWHDQFGTSGCVGCGRCITWCPVGIDITEEAAHLRRDGDAP